MVSSKVLALAAGSGRIGYMYLVNGVPVDWRLSRRACESTELAAQHAKGWIDRLRPEVVVTEKITERCRKGERTRAVIAAMANVAANEMLFDVEVARPYNFQNKHEEAKALADRFPNLRPWVPKPRKVWESEPHESTYFEALALALVVIDREGADHD